MAEINQDRRGLFFPVHLRCTTVADALTGAGLEDALARALGRAFAHARAALPAATATGDYIQLHPPFLTAGDLAPDQAAALLRRVSSALDRAARAQRLPLHAPTIAERPSPPAPVPIDGSELIDPRRYDPGTNSYDVPSYDGGRRQVPVRAVANPFAQLLARFDQTIAAIDALLSRMAALRDPNQHRRDEQGNVEALRRGTDFERNVIVLVADVVKGRTRPEDIPAGQRRSYDRAVALYAEPGKRFPVRASVAAREAQLLRGQLILAMVRARIMDLDRQANAVTDTQALQRAIAQAVGDASAGGSDSQTVLRETYMDLSAYYLAVLSLRTKARSLLEAVTVAQDRALAQLAFLDTFYADPQRVVLYAAIRFVRGRVPELWENLRRIAPGLEGGIVIFDLENTTPYGPNEFPRTTRLGAFNWALTHALALRRLYEPIGDLPGSQQDAQGAPTAQVGAQISALFDHLQVEIAVLALWQPIAGLYQLVFSHPQIGQSLFSFGRPEREDWLQELQLLERAFATELSTYPHPDIAQRVDYWERRVNALLGTIVSAAHRADIVAAIIEQIPFLLIGGEIAAGIGAWVRLATSSRWLVALAEGAAFTTFNALTAPPGARPTSALGWAGQLALNVGWARIGRVLFEAGGDLAGRLGQSRRALLTIGAGVVLPGLSLTALQTLAQEIERRARGQGGESSITELFTVNLIMNALGLLVSAGMPRPEPPSGPSGAMLRYSPADLARRTSISETAAAAWLDLAGRADEFQTRFRTLAEAARRGTLDRAAFEQLQREGLALADELAQKLPILAEALGTGQSAGTIQAAIARLRALLAGLTYTPGQAPVLALPELVSGLTPAPNGITWLYDPDRPPARLANVRQSSVERGYSVHDLPGGGWEATDAQGQVVLQLLPAPVPAAGELPPSLEGAASSPQAAAGLTQVRAQTAAPQLEAQLAQALVQSGASPVTRLMRIVGRFIAPDNQDAWLGLSTYLRLEGDPALLARVLTFRDSQSLARENALHADTVLRQLAAWDASAVRGLHAAYQIRRNLTTERIANLFANFEPEQVKGIFQSIDFLAARSRGLGHLLGPLTSGNIPQERGAIGALTSGVQLAERYPDTIISFEEPVTKPSGAVIRIQDINVIRRETMRVAGEVRTAETTLASFEIKEVSTVNLGRRAPHELAIDIVLDAHARAQRPTPIGAARPFFETFRWRIRRLNLERIAALRAGIGDVHDPRIEQAMRDIVKDQLRAAFNDPALQSLSPQEIQGYRNAFDHGVPFVEFF
jgi:hypothetical protein